tara:strand:- start:1714 stop:1911 length:198 start_codon:yes stop_codon:yes gene_type:complete
MDYKEMLDDIIEWSCTQEHFHASTFYGIRDNYEKYNSFTYNQKRAIENVYFKFNVDKWNETRTNE